MQIHELPSAQPTTLDYIPFDTGSGNYKARFEDFEAGGNLATFTCDDNDTPTGFRSMPLFEYNTIGNLFEKISRLFSNVRYIWQKLGSGSFSTSASTAVGAINEIVAKIGNKTMGTTATTLTGAIKEVNDKFTSETLVPLVPGLVYRGSITAFNTATTNGMYIYTSSATNRPPINAGGAVLVIRGSSSDYVTQIAFCNLASDSAVPPVYIRRTYAEGLWTDWSKVAYTS